MKSDLTIYIDEGGDHGVRDGLHYLETMHEWFSIGAFVVRTSLDQETSQIVDEIKDKCRVWQSPTLHYYKLKEDRRTQACSILAEKRARAFCVVVTCHE
jgi:hypothetical protein